ncbi:putative reverse transcriptase domain-containing protein [Tanacetum coccineum]
MPHPSRYFKLPKTSMEEMMKEWMARQIEANKRMKNQVNSNEIHVDPNKIEAVKNWKVPKTPSGIRSFLGLAGGGSSYVVADALSRKERVKPKGVRAMTMTIQSGVRGIILASQGKALKQENVLAERLHGLYQQMKRKEDESLYFIDRICVSLVGGDVRTLMMDEAHASRYLVHSGEDKTYYDLRDMYGGHVIVNMMTKSAHFLAMREDYSTERLAKLYIDEIVARHRVPVSIILDQDGHGQSERTIQTLEDMLRACVLDFGGNWDVYLPLAEFSYNNTYHSSIRYAPFEALYERKCRSPVLWAEIRESSLIGPDLVQGTTGKVVLIKEKLKAARDRQKSYADNRRKPLEFEVGD